MTSVLVQVAMYGKRSRLSIGSMVRNGCMVSAVKNRGRRRFLAELLTIALCGILAACQKGKQDLRGWWELDLEKTLAQYREVPTGYASMSLVEFQSYLRDGLTGRTYNFDTKQPR